MISSALAGGGGGDAATVGTGVGGSTAGSELALGGKTTDPDCGAGTSVGEPDGAEASGALPSIIATINGEKPTQQVSDTVDYKERLNNAKRLSGDWELGFKLIVSQISRDFSSFLEKHGYGSMQSLRR